jgi:hypothetical protein
VPPPFVNYRSEILPHISLSSLECGYPRLEHGSDVSKSALLADYSKNNHWHPLAANLRQRIASKQAMSMTILLITRYRYKKDFPTMTKRESGGQPQVHTLVGFKLREAVRILPVLAAMRTPHHSFCSSVSLHDGSDGNVGACFLVKRFGQDNSSRKNSFVIHSFLNDLSATARSGVFEMLCVK